MILFTSDAFVKTCIMLKILNAFSTWIRRELIQIGSFLFILSNDWGARRAQVFLGQTKKRELCAYSTFTFVCKPVFNWLTTIHGASWKACLAIALLQCVTFWHTVLLRYRKCFTLLRLQYCLFRDDHHFF